MTKYKFIKPYSAQITVGGVVGVMTKSFAIGDIYEGKQKSDGIEIRIAEHTALQTPEPSNTSYQEFLTIPNEYMNLAFPTGMKSPPMSGLAKFGICIVIILAIVAILKIFKVF